MVTAEELIHELESLRNERQAAHLMRFFKTGKGDYGEGDCFLGLKVPETRLIVREARCQVALSEIEKLLYSRWHEVRLCGFLLLVEEMKAALPKRRESTTSKADRREEIAHFFLRHACQANNWDLVDLSCPKILGEWLLYPSATGELPDTGILDRLAASTNLWEQRIGIVTTLRLIQDGRFADTIRISEMLLTHRHDLIHKATGWMLRELGKRDMSMLTDFLERHYAEMPRTALRYAIEKMNEQERKYWLQRK